MSAFLARATFLKGARKLAQLTPDIGVEVAFAGRSNAGKSSAINTLVGARSLARTSKTPGRTREINFFGLDDDRRLVDLPGYGYAKVSKTMKAEWVRLLEAYLTTRASLAGVVVIMDVRHPYTSLDQQLIGWCVAAGLPVHGLLTKCDKLSRGRGMQALKACERETAPLGKGLSLQLFSAHQAIGLEAARARLLDWLGVESPEPWR